MDADQAGWFALGPPPGAVGSSIILGHVDSVAGPAVLAKLKDLVRGDRVEVVRADGSIVTFRVMRSALCLNEEFSARRVYQSRTLRRLNLVTCGGAYNADRGGYRVEPGGVHPTHRLTTNEGPGNARAFVVERMTQMS